MIPEDLVKVWYNPENGWFELFDKDGKPIESGLCDASVTIFDNFTRQVKEGLPMKICSLKIEMMCQVVNDRPVWKIR